MSCEHCFNSGRGLNEKLESMIAKAKQYAVREKKTVIVYQEGLDFNYIEYDIAISQQYPIVQVVSQYP